MDVKRFDKIIIEYIRGNKTECRLKDIMRVMGVLRTTGDDFIMFRRESDEECIGNRRLMKALQSKGKR